MYVHFLDDVQVWINHFGGAKAVKTTWAFMPIVATCSATNSEIYPEFAFISLQVATAQ